MATQIIFYIFSTIACISGLVVITARNPVHSVLALVLTFVAMAGVWLLLYAELIALNLIIVYVGAVMTLFLFVVMMLPVESRRSNVFDRYAPYSILLVGGLISTVILTLACYFRYYIQPVEQINQNNVRVIGNLLYTQYFYPVELSGAILLLAVIAAISLAKHKPGPGKKQQVREQHMINPRDRVRLVNISVKGEENASAE